MKSTSNFSDIFRAVLFAGLAFVVYEYTVSDDSTDEKPRYVISEDRR